MKIPIILALVGALFVLAFIAGPKLRQHTTTAANIATALCVGFHRTFSPPIPFAFARHPVGTLNHEQNTRVVWAPSVASADLSEVTAAELTAGTDITSYLTKDGLETPADQQMVDNAGLDENFNAQGVGNYGGGINLKCFRTATDAAWTLFVYGTAGYIVIGRDSAGGIGTGDALEVYPAEMHEPVMMNTAENERQKFSAKCAVTAAPNKNAAAVA